MKKTVGLQLQVAPETKRALRILAAEQGTSMAALVTRWVLDASKERGAA